VCHCSFTYLLLPSICACTEENVETVNNSVLSQEEKPQTRRTVREISRETGISYVSRISCKDLHLKCFKRCRAQELTDANCAVRMKHVKLLLAFRSSRIPLTKVRWVVSHGCYSTFHSDEHQCRNFENRLRFDKVTDS